MRTVEIAFRPGDTVNIKALGYPGMVDEVSLRECQCGECTVARFNVVWWQDMKRTEAWMTRHEIEAPRNAPAH